MTALSDLAAKYYGGVHTVDAWVIEHRSLLLDVAIAAEAVDDESQVGDEISSTSEAMCALRTALSKLTEAANG